MESFWHQLRNINSCLHLSGIDSHSLMEASGLFFFLTGNDGRREQAGCNKAELGSADSPCDSAPPGISRCKPVKVVWTRLDRHTHTHTALDSLHSRAGRLGVQNRPAGVPSSTLVMFASKYTVCVCDQPFHVPLRISAKFKEI